MKSLKKINLKSVFDTLGDREMKNIVGGYGEGDYDGWVFFRCIGEGNEVYYAGIAESCEKVMDSICDPSDGVWCKNI